jgi:hypothetical protein
MGRQFKIKGPWRIPMKRTFSTLAVAALIASGSAFAQQSQPSTQPNQPTPTVNDRRENQQDRIANGVQSGQLTAGETKNLESREASLNNEIKDDREADGGKLTSAEHQQINNQQNHLSNSIYADKHNAATQNYKGEVGARQENQQDRIAQGIRSGQMTAGETARAEGHEQRHQPADSRRPLRQRRNADRLRTPPGESRTEWRQPPDLPGKAQRKITRSSH